MKNYPKPSLIEMMKSLYYFFENNYIDYPHLLQKLNSVYDVHHIEIRDRFTCYQRINGSDLETSILI